MFALCFPFRVPVSWLLTRPSPLPSTLLVNLPGAAKVEADMKKLKKQIKPEPAVGKKK